MASGVSVSGRRHYDSAYSSAGNHLVAGRPFAKTFKITHGADSTDDSILTFVSPTAGVAAVRCDAGIEGCKSLALYSFKCHCVWSS